MTFRTFVAALVVALAGCATPAPRGPVAPAPGEPARPERPVDSDDPVLGGMSLAGTWSAIEIEGDARATRDLARGVLEQTLIVRPGGNAILTGHDRREGSGTPVTLGGQIEGDLLTFAGLSGAARLSMRGRRLVVRDPRGRTTVFVRVGR